MSAHRDKADAVIRTDDLMPTERGVPLGWVDANALALAQGAVQVDDAAHTLFAAAELNENYAGDNVSVTIPIEAWRAFTEVIDGKLYCTAGCTGPHHRGDCAKAGEVRYTK